jgi:hypothetical protein
MSYPKLVTLLRQGLQSLYSSAAKLERQWLKEALLPQTLPRLKRQQMDASRANKDTLEKSAIVESSTQGRQVATAPDSAYGVVEKPVRWVENPTGVKAELWEMQLRSGLTIMQERLGKL